MANAMRVDELWKYSIGDVGLELEFTNINRNFSKFVDDMNNLGLRVVHDASNETPRLCIQNLSINVEPGNDDFNLLAGKLGFGYNVFGGEAISNIYLIEQNSWKDTIFKITHVFSIHGETEVCTRDSLHVHVNVGNAIDFRTLLRLLKMEMAYEYILYKLGGMGCINRGLENSFIYQRPYTPKGPPVVKANRYAYPIFYVDDLLSAKNKSEFFSIFGDSAYCAENGIRYVTQRYMGLNFYSIPVRGSLEFRYANKTLNPQWIVAWTEFCSSFVRKAFFQTPDETEYIRRPLTMGHVTDEDFNNVIDSFAFLSKESAHTLAEIWRNTPDINYVDNWTYSHLPSPTFYRSKESVFYYPKVLHEKAVEPKVSTVHELNELFNTSFKNAKNMYKLPKGILEVNPFEINIPNIHDEMEDKIRKERHLQSLVKALQESTVTNVTISFFDFIEFEDFPGKDIGISRAHAGFVNFEDIFFSYTVDTYEWEDEDGEIFDEYLIDLYIHMCNYVNDKNKYCLVKTFDTKKDDQLLLNLRDLFRRVEKIILHKAENDINLFHTETGEYV